MGKGGTMRQNSRMRCVAPCVDWLTCCLLLPCMTWCAHSWSVEGAGVLYPLEAPGPLDSPSATLVPPAFGAFRAFRATREGLVYITVRSVRDVALDVRFQVQFHPACPFLLPGPYALTPLAPRCRTVS